MGEQLHWRRRLRLAWCLIRKHPLHLVDVPDEYELIDVEVRLDGTLVEEAWMRLDLSCAACRPTTV